MKIKIFLILIVILTSFLRLYQLGSYPATLYGDEQAFAWNAYSILKTGQDEYGTPFPLQFRSFDDYKAPIPVYLLVPFIKILGMNAFSIRLPIALAGILSIIICYFLCRKFVSAKASLIMTFLFSISPWHMHLSRGYFEATLALLFFIAGVYFFIKEEGNLKLSLLGIFFFVLALYSYFTPRILIPFIFIFLCLYIGFKKHFSKQIVRTIILSFILLLILAVPLVKSTFFGNGLSRFNKLTDTNSKIVSETVNRERSTSLLSNKWRVIFHNKFIVWARLIKNNYLEHLSLNFWYLYGDNSLRYFTGNMGMFYLIEMPFFLLGLYRLWKVKRETAILFIGWILLAPIPASLVGRSFAVRSLAMLPAPFIFTAYGIDYSLFFFKKYMKVWTAAVVISCLFTVSLGMLLIRYYQEYPVYAATWWGWENKKAIDYAKKYEDQYDYIFISDFYTGAPLAYAVYNSYDPVAFRRALQNPVVLSDNRHFIELGKYYFGSLDLNKERLNSNIIPSRSLYIARPEEADSNETINAPDDGRIIFKIYKTK